MELVEGEDGGLGCYLLVTGPDSVFYPMWNYCLGWALKFESLERWMLVAALTSPLSLRCFFICLSNPSVDRLIGNLSCILNYSLFFLNRAMVK